MVNRLGFEILLDDSFRRDAYLFGEGQGRVVVSVDNQVGGEFEDFMMDSGVPMVYLGHVTGGKIVVEDMPMGKIGDYAELYDTAIGKKMEE